MGAPPGGSRCVCYLLAILHDFYAAVNFTNISCCAYKLHGRGMEELRKAFSFYATNNSWTNSNFLLFSGGTDIISCFAGQNPTVPVYRGEIQTRNLGMAVESWSDEGNRLILTYSFPQICPVAQFRRKEERSNLVRYNFFIFSRQKDWGLR